MLADFLFSTSILALESKASRKRPVFHPVADHFGERERRVSPARSVIEEGVSLHLQGQASAAFNAVEAFRPPIIDPCEISEDVVRLILAHRRLNALMRQAFVQR